MDGLNTFEKVRTRRTFSRYPHPIVRTPYDTPFARTLFAVVHLLYEGSTTDMAAALQTDQGLIWRCITGERKPSPTLTRKLRGLLHNAHLLIAQSHLREAEFRGKMVLLIHALKALPDPGPRNTADQVARAQAGKAARQASKAPGSAPERKPLDLAAMLLEFDNEPAKPAGRGQAPGSAKTATPTATRKRSKRSED